MRTRRLGEVGLLEALVEGCNDAHLSMALAV